MKRPKTGGMLSQEIESVLRTNQQELLELERMEMRKKQIGDRVRVVNGTRIVKIGLELNLLNGRETQDRRTMFACKTSAGPVSINNNQINEAIGKMANELELKK